MDDIRDPEIAERLAGDAPDEFLKRREFLARTAMTAGLAASLGTVLDPDTLVAAAARRQRRKPLPAPRNMPVDTFVVLMMENRSFDHYFGWMPNADGRQSGLSYEDKQGRKIATHALAPDYQGCGHPDPDHGWSDGRTQINRGRMDGFLKSPTNDEYALGYYRENDLAFLPKAARAFTAFDRFFCSILASTFPNREYLWAGQSYGEKSNTLPIRTGGFPDTSIIAAAERAGISARYFNVDLPVSSLWGAPMIARTSRVEEFYVRCAAGTLPRISFVDPPFGDIGAAGGGGSDHPHSDVRVGQAFISDVVHAVMESPQWPRTALFVVYDEWGGFFDHVRPPRVPDQRASRDVANDFGQLGIRIPALAISPYARAGHVDHGIYAFESILKMIEYRLGLRPLTLRDRYATNIAQAFDWESKPRLEPPRLPDPPATVKLACSAPPIPGGTTLPPPTTGAPTSAKRRRSASNHHPFMDMHTSGYLERVGFEFRPATPESTFRQPSATRQALRETE